MNAIPTTFNGIKYRSRLEARWAEFLANRNIDFEYEPEWPGSYRPDFLLTDFSVYVEVKPAALLQELQLFRHEIMTSCEHWICVDKASRSTWHVIEYNLTFWERGVEMILPLPIDFRREMQGYEAVGGLQQMIFDCPLIINAL
jgi:hypothetical protein